MPKMRQKHDLKRDAILNLGRTGSESIRPASQCSFSKCTDLLGATCGVLLDSKTLRTQFPTAKRLPLRLVISAVLVALAPLFSGPRPYCDAKVGSIGSSE